MKHLLATLAALAAIVGTAPATAADVPNGRGLEHVLGELVCGPDTTFDVLVTPGGGATGWRVDQGQHHVLSYFSITYHFDSGDVTEAKTWGNKSGIAPLMCEPQFYPGIPELGIPAVTIEGTIHPLPGR
jgi:opacity protein-like surface antigen